MSQSVHLFGVRHHGPGCARSLLRALEDLQPDVLLVEGPPDADAMLSFVPAEGMEPPLALLLYAPDEPKRAAYFPFATFSPEWQALRYAAKAGIPARFMDLPQTHQVALAKEEELRLAKEEEMAATDDPSPSEISPISLIGPISPIPATPAPITEEEAPKPAPIEPPNPRHDPLGWLGRAAGYGGGEEWWEHMVEQRLDGTELFDAIAEAMTAVRAESAPLADPYEDRREALREAHMRKTIRAAMAEGHQKIAVVCGAWHVPALAVLPPAAKDNALLKNLPKIKVEAAWVPWTYDRLAAESGYGAGVDSPAWYEHLWNKEGHADTPAWFARVARLLRAQDLDCSPAHVIECVRLSETLAAFRDRPRAGLAEMMEAARTILTMGEDSALALIRRELIIGQRMGSVAEDVPTVPLQRDIEKQQKSLKLKASASSEEQKLDLRKDLDLARSALLHRLQLLGVPWGSLGNRAGKGTFWELWTLQWKPEFALAIIEVTPFGNTVTDAASARAVKQAFEAKELPALTELVSQLLLADLPEALRLVMRELENRAAITGDVLQLIRAIPPLAQVLRYGNVRQTDLSQVTTVVDSLLTRVCVGLMPACSALDDEAAQKVGKALATLNSAVQLLDKAEHRDLWLPALARAADSTVHAGLRGLATRILFDEKHADIAVTSERMNLALSRAVAPDQAAAWLEGFLGGGGMVLVHDPVLFGLVDEWLGGLSEEHFTQVLPLARRTFSTFPPMERREIGLRAAASAGGKPSGQGGGSEPGETHWDEARVAKLAPVLRKIFGLETRTA